MVNKKTYFDGVYYYKEFELISGVRFTPREIDVLSFLYKGKGDKSIASNLSINKKTAESHIASIKKKMGYIARENITDAIDKSGKSDLIRHHYKHLLLQKKFEECLKKISTLLKQEQISCFFPFVPDQKDFYFLFQTIIKDLECVGIETSYKENKQFHSSSLGKEKYDIFFIEKEEIFENFPKISQNLNNSIFIFLDEIESKGGLKEFKNIIFLSFKEEGYYFSFFKLLQKMIPHENFEDIILFFKEEHAGTSHSNDFTAVPGENLLKSGETLGFSKKSLRNLSSEDGSSSGLKTTLGTADDFISSYRREEIRTGSISKSLFSPIIKEKKHAVLAGIFGVVFLCIGIFGLKKEPFQEIIPQYELQKNKSIRSDLNIPTDAVFLKRPYFIKQMNNKLEGDKRIQTIALIGLVGIGGAGKTTLARAYGKFHQASLVWEVNAETKESLITSFKDLACRLAQTKKQKEEIDFIQKIQNQEEKEKEILYFVKDHLREHPNWILIFDNVENFSEKKEYFPQDPQAWGPGRVIITTRDSNIKNTSYIKKENIFEIIQLSEEEGLNLLSKILYNIEENNLTSEKRKESIKFLKNIPPFPLDISTAAYYIKDTHISYDEYLKRLKDSVVEFTSTQESLLKEMSDYTKTRYGIVTLALEEIINKNSDFKDLLLFISLLDSQDIPLDLLKKYKKELIVERFIHELTRHSLITPPQSKIAYQLCLTFSIHRSTQEISLIYLKKRLGLKNYHEILDKIAQVLEQYIGSILKVGNIQILNHVVPHVEMFISNIDLMIFGNDDYSLQSFEFLKNLGTIHRYLSEFKKL